ncbi:MAG: preprotein translocase subunit SecE [Lentisphaerae bacterium]|jgi:preprotein translocase subunit SecE|nr:preprotein translocase subunit SecE [Lentisphaerota bacterium]
MAKDKKTTGQRIQGFLSEVGAEFRRITWPERQELIESTVVVIVFIVILAAVVLVYDKVIEAALQLIHS